MTYHFSFRIGDLEARSCNDSLLNDGDHTTGEIVCWENLTTCYVVAYWVKNREGYDLKFVGARPFDPDLERDDFFTLAELGQKILTSVHCAS